ncbi:recombinase family protein [Patescibacteria group bacterium]|nr:recombinase family protein [Patescibacteria group bacterium]
MKNTDKKCILYCRVSSKEQEEKGYSLEAQEKLLKDYASRNDFSIVKTYKISESASGKLIRKTFSEMLVYTKKNKLNLILVEKIDRLTRNLRDAAIISDWINEDEKHEIHFVKENFIVNRNTRAHENLVWDMKVAIARFYTNNLSEEVKKGQKAKLESGWMPQRPCLGYKTIGNKGHKTHIIDEKIAPLIRQAFELYASGNYSLNFLAEVMFDEGLKASSGKMLAKNTLHNMLTNPFYTGQIIWNNKTYSGNHEPIVDFDLFDKVQIRIKRKLSATQFKKHIFIFKGNIRCAECGGIISWSQRKGHIYGTCNHYRSCSQNTRVREQDLIEQLMPYLEEIKPKTPKLIDWLEKAIKEDEPTDNSLIEAQKQALEQSLKRIDNRIDLIYDDKLDGKITEDFYTKKYNEFNAEKIDLEKKLKQINPGSGAVNYEKGIKLHRLASEASNLIIDTETDIENKRLALSELFSDFELDADKIRPKYTLGGEFLAKWMPRVNNSFGPIEFGEYYEKTDAFAPACSSMLPGWDSNPRPIGYTYPLIS